MANDEWLEHYRAYREAQDKYIYFLLAAAGAAIGLAVNQTIGSALAWSQLPLGLGVLSWAGSFCAGCRKLHYVHASLYGNAELLLLQRGQHPKVGQNPQLAADVSEILRKGMESDSEKAGLYGRLQFRLLVVGAAVYVGWHVWEMYLRSLPAST